MTEASSGAGTGSGKYGLGIFDLRKLMEFRGHESLEEFNKLGGPQELAKKLNTDTEKGVKNNQTEVNERQQTFGKNSIPPKEPQTIWELCMATLEDQTLQILIFCAVFSVVLAFFNLVTSDCSGNKVELQCEPRFNATHDSDSARFMEQRFLNYHISENQIQETDMRNFARAGGDLCDKNIPALVKYADFVEGLMIILTILIIMFLTAGNDYFKEKQFRSLQDKLSNDKTATVIRDGENQEVLVSELVVGDLVQIKYGDLLPADGMLVASNDLKVDESSLTGESDHVKKGVNKDPALLGGTHVMEGSGRMIVTAVGVNSQSGIIFVLLGAGGEEAQNQGQPGDEENQTGGQKVEKDSDSIDASDETKSILQAKLDELTVVITYVGTAACFLTLIILGARFVFTMWFYSESYTIQLNATTGEIIPQADLPDELKIKPNEVFPFSYCALAYLGKVLSFVIIGVTVLVVAIPEGLPLAVTISLALSVKKMMKDNNLVRHLDSCETMGNATAICSDKTGTLTTNRMTVVQSYLNAKIFRECVPNPMSMPTNVKDLLLDGIAINTSYTSKVVPDENGGRDLQLGNKTECALLGFVNEMAAETGVTYQDIRDKHPESSFVKVYTFNSARKSMSTIINNGENGFRIFTKGASEIICRRSAFILNQAGEAQKFGNIERKQMQENVINTMASDGLRTIGLAYRDVPADFDLEDENEIGSNLTLIGVVGIEDPVRPEVPKAIKQCQMAGITVRMVTGDNVMTARSIAQKCGIIEPGDTNSLVLEGKEFNKEIRDIKGNVKQSKIDEIWPRLRVLARSSPADKHTLVKGMIDSKLADQGLQIVAVTGDGTNDGPALKVADVGFAMGIAGTDVAKEASDIILIDDNFRSIVRAVMWGRNVYDNISKFLQFQLTVNVCAILCAVIGSATTGASPLKAVQMLWVNLIMDTFASIALAAEPPTEALLNRKPYPRNKALISVVMAKNIFCHAFYQFVIMLIALFLPSFLPCNRNLPASDVEKGRITQCWGSGETKDPAATWGVTPYDRYELSGKMAKSFPTEQFTLVFNLFVCLQLFNQINARMIHGEWNVFKGILNNRSYLIILIGEFLAQIFMVQQAGQFTTCSTLDMTQWIFCILVGATELIFGQVVNVIPTAWFESLIGFIVQTRQNLASSKIEVQEHANATHHKGKRIDKQIDVVKRYSIAPGEMSNTDLTKVRQSLGHRNNYNETLEPTLKNQNQPLDTIPSGEMTTETTT